jgi:hypothetical protein
MCQVPILEVRDSLCAIFQKWGKPGSMRVDNGEPLGSPSTDTTTPLALWCIGHDIDMIWNKPRTPQLNGVVEHMQDTSQRWAEIDRAIDIDDLQKRLDREAIIQREKFNVSRLDYKTRLEAFPELLSAQRPWQPMAENHFDENRVYRFLAKKTYSRKVSKAGQINLFAHKLRVGGACVGKYVQIKLDAQKLAWIIYDNYEVVKTIPCKMLDKQNIENLSVMSKNKISES